MATKGIFVFICYGVSLAAAFSAFTGLHIDNHPCKPENLKHTNRYICDNQGNIICQAGWREPNVRDLVNVLNPCLEPVCDIDNKTCSHGECRAPNYCACEIGWEGTLCEKCVPLPGCEHGDCNNAFECNCDQGYTGAYCNIAVCSQNCTHGHCIAPDVCSCFDGWLGEDCSRCEIRAGCQHGSCGQHPYTCECDPGWTGHLCDQPVCDQTCDHGFCHSVYNADTDEFKNMCICEPGWQGADCSICVPYWRCPNTGTNACTKPNECLCFNNESDPNNLCNNTLLTQNFPRYRSVEPTAIANDSQTNRDSPLVSLISGGDLIPLGDLETGVPPSN